MLRARFIVSPCYRPTVRAAASLISLLAIGGCGDDAITALDLSVAWSDQGDTLTLSVGGQRRAMAAFYSFYVEPLSPQGRVDAYLVVTAVDAAFDCAHPTGGLDAVAFLFPSRGVGGYTDMVLSRRGPTLGGLVDAVGSAELDADDDQLRGWDLDGGTVSAGNGSVAGRLQLVGGNVTLSGHFTAARCAALDFIVPG
jgi:hypothetical protein